MGIRWQYEKDIDPVGVTIFRPWAGEIGSALIHFHDHGVTFCGKDAAYYDKRTRQYYGGRMRRWEYTDMWSAAFLTDNGHEFCRKCYAQADRLFGKG